MSIAEAFPFLSLRDRNRERPPPLTEHL